MLEELCNEYAIVEEPTLLKGVWRVKVYER